MRFFVENTGAFFLVMREELRRLAGFTCLVMMVFLSKGVVLRRPLWLEGASVRVATATASERNRERDLLGWITLKSVRWSRVS